MTAPVDPPRTDDGSPDSGSSGTAEPGTASDGDAVDQEFIIGNALYDDSIIVLPRPVVLYLADVRAALASGTWGELRMNAEPDIYAEILGQAGYGSAEDFLRSIHIGDPVPGAETMALQAYAAKAGEPIPDDDEPFDAGDIGSYADGDYPPAAQRLMVDLVPDVVLDRFGDFYDTIFNGRFVRLPGDQEDTIIATLEQAGYRCVADQALIASIQPE